MTLNHQKYFHRVDTLFQKSIFGPKSNMFGSLVNYLLELITSYKLGWVEFYRNKKFKVGFVKMYFLGKNWIFNLVWMSWVVNLKRAQIPIEVYSVLLEWTDLWKRSRQSRDLKRRKGLHCCSFVKFNSSWWLFPEASKHSCYFSRKKERRLKKKVFSL